MDNIDFLGNGTAQGEVAQAIMSNGKMDPGALKPFVHTDGRSYVQVYTGGDPSKPESYKNIMANAGATLRRDEWKKLDDAVLQISRSRLGGVQDLIDNGLVYNLGNGMGTTVLEYHDISDALAAELTMDGVTRAKGDRPEFTTKYLPIPIIHADYEINSRVLAASRNMGNPLDTTLAEIAARKVSEKLEAMLFTSTSYTFGGGTIYSYLNHPDINPVTLDIGWDHSACTGAKIVSDILEMKQASIAAKHYGPWMIYIPTAYETTLDDDYNTYRGETIRQRILSIAGIKGIKVVDSLTADNVLLVQMTSDCVRLVQGMGIQNVEWTTEGNFVHKYKVMQIAVPQVRSDQAGHSGITLLA